MTPTITSNFTAKYPISQKVKFPTSEAKALAFAHQLNV